MATRALAACLVANPATAQEARGTLTANGKSAVLDPAAKTVPRK